MYRNVYSRPERGAATHVVSARPAHRPRPGLPPTMYRPAFEFCSDLFLSLGLSREWSLRGALATAPHGEVPGGEDRATARPGRRGRWLVPGGPEGRWRVWAASPQVSGRCSEATRMGPPAGPRPPGGKGLQTCERGLHRAGARGRLPRTWGALRPPLGDTLPAPRHPVRSPGGPSSAGRLEGQAG